MGKLEPTAEQLELIAKAAGMAVWEMQIAFDIANSIPEGAPVGTIARRPDGGYIAIMNELGWEYFYLDVRKPRLDTDGDHADSWPQIRPDQWPGKSGLDWFPPGEEPLVTRPDPDPTAQQVPETCRICNGSGVGYGKVPGGWLETDCAACDATGEAQQEPGKSLARGLDDLAAGRVSRRDDYLEPQQEPATTHSVSPESTNCVPKPRTPRVVDRLGVDGPFTEVIE
ncbi:Uncharacterised protein [Mycobacteroides abscessus subsp. massiliense]|uniref:hypothetical protein n=1 Tax=Mycobacteroides abscessus TaxID=36809 RepID=UPI0009C6CA0F|nr:hypothetical protein [Mycobacteroides abscessus]SLH91437.1 Uncharacterised protein [Mycobacteroides abscessus subsp. massiliense]SLI31602.1 Uncharacterised protein [Mycobacteroides abscessus subsp. massiliense]